MQLNWYYKAFNDLSATELYAVMQLRNEVFIIEQNCVYQDADNKDALSFHLCGWHNDILVAYCRILPAGIAFDEPSIGRVVVSSGYRKTGSGRELVQKAIVKTKDQFKQNKITIGAQLYLQHFYTSLGFVQVSGTYIEDGITHIEMQYKF